METIKPLTRAQEIFGAQFGKRPIINERPEGMPFNQYQKIRRDQTETIKRVLR